MRRLAIALALIAASCGGGDATTTTTVPQTTTITVTSSTTTTRPPSTSTTSSTTTSSTTTSSTTTTTSVPGFVFYMHPEFALSHPGTWQQNSDFPGTGVGFLEDHTALALPATTVDIFLERQEDGFDLDAHIERIKEDLAFFVPEFRVLHSGEEDVDGVRSVWFEYAEEFDGFPIAIREQVALRDGLLVTFTLISPVEFFQFDVSQFAQVVGSFRFS